MKTVTYDEFLKFEPCWLNCDDGAAKLEEIGKRQEQWTAMDVLNLPEDEVSAEDKLWAVLRPEFIEKDILHEFACRCAEEALSHIENPDPRSVAAIEAKRKWMRGEISDEELDATRDAAWSAARNAARYVAWSAALSATMDATCCAARFAACSAAWYAVMSAAMDAARSAARTHQVEMLKELLEDD